MPSAVIFSRPPTGSPCSTCSSCVPPLQRLLQQPSRQGSSSSLHALPHPVWSLGRPRHVTAHRSAGCSRHCDRVVGELSDSCRCAGFIQALAKLSRPPPPLLRGAGGPLALCLPWPLRTSPVLRLPPQISQVRSSRLQRLSNRLGLGLGLGSVGPGPGRTLRRKLEEG
jgi:hypothetical protein